jgi:hypothetical protein
MNLAISKAKSSGVSLVVAKGTYAACGIPWCISSVESFLCPTTRHARNRQTDIFIETRRRLVESYDLLLLCFQFYLTYDYASRYSEFRTLTMCIVMIQTTARKVSTNSPLFFRIPQNKLYFSLFLWVYVRNYRRRNVNNLQSLLGAIAKLWNATVIYIISVCPSVRLTYRVEQFGFYWTDFH